MQSAAARFPSRPVVIAPVLVLLLAFAGPTVAVAQGPAVTQEDRAASQALLAKLASLREEQEVAGVLDLLDGEALIGTALDRMHAFGGGRESVDRLRPVMEGMIGLALAPELLHVAWERLEIHRIARVEDGSLVVVVRGWDSAEQVSNKLRLWLRTHEDGLRIADMEPIDLGMRMTDLIAVRVAAVQASSAPAELRSFAEASEAMERGDTAAALALLEPIDEDSLPASLEGLRLLMLGILRIELGEYAEADRLLEAAGATGRDIPVLGYLRAVTRNELGDPASALESARRYVEETGFDSDAGVEIGDALLGLGREREAREAFDRALDENPRHPEAFAAWASLLPQERKALIAERMAEMDSPREGFEWMAQSLYDRGDPPGLRVLVDSYRKREPDDPEADYHEALLLMDEGRYEEAAAMVRTAWPDVGDEEQRLYYVDLYLDAMLGANQPIEAYHAAPDKRHAYDYLAADLYDLDDRDALRALTDLHEPGHPRDPWLHFYRGSLHLEASRFEEADAAFGRGLALDPDEETREQLLWARARARHGAGREATAYRELGRHGLVFESLAWAMSSAEEPVALRRLLAERREDAPEDPRIPFFEAQALWLEGETAKAVRAFGATRAFAQRSALEGDDSFLAWIEDRLVRGHLRLRRYDLALVSARESTARDGNPYYEVIVHAVEGNVQAARLVLQSCFDLGIGPEVFLDDPDAGPRFARTPLRELLELPDDEADEGED